MEKNVLKKIFGGFCKSCKCAINILNRLFLTSIDINEQEYLLYDKI